MILVIGASGGVGSYVFSELSKMSEGVYGTSNTSQIDSPYMIKVDITNHLEVFNMINRLKSPVSILINCSGVNYNSFVHNAEYQNWNHVINVNLIGAFNIVNAVLPSMRLNKFGRIINMSSVVTKTHPLGTSAYTVSKCGLNSFSKIVAKQNGRYGITSNIINLGYTDVGMIKQVPAQLKEEIISSIPLQRTCTLQQIMNSIRFIIGCQYFNGAELDLTGGI